MAIRVLFKLYCPVTDQSHRSGYCTSYHGHLSLGVPPLPVVDSAAATLSREIVIIGGGGRPPVKTIHQLFNGQWVKIGCMSCDRRWCLIVSPSPGKMMIVGGEGALDSVEECVVV